MVDIGSSTVRFVVARAYNGIFGKEDAAGGTGPSTDGRRCVPAATGIFVVVVVSAGDNGGIAATPRIVFDTIAEHSTNEGDGKTLFPTLFALEMFLPHFAGGSTDDRIFLPNFGHTPHRSDP